MKRFLTLIIAIAMVFTFTACNNEYVVNSSLTDESTLGDKNIEFQESSTYSDKQKQEAESTVSDKNNEFQESSIPSDKQEDVESTVSDKNIEFQESSITSGVQEYDDYGESNNIPIITLDEYFQANTFSEPSTYDTVHYLFHKPIRDTGKSYPLIIFLHSLGDTVSKWSFSTAGPLVNSLIRLENESEKYSAYTLVPSTPIAEEGWWTYSQLATFKELIYRLVENNNIDPKRIYITGISMGGFTTCQLVNEMPPNTFAAAVPLSGASNMTYPETLHNTAFRIYHSKNDAIVNVSCSRDLNEQLILSGHPKVEYIEFEYGDHMFPMHSVYMDECFFDWLFAQRLP